MMNDTKFINRYLGNNRFQWEADEYEIRQIRALVAWVARNFGGVEVVRIGEEEGGAERRDSDPE